jgi:hypothetical protein
MLNPFFLNGTRSEQNLIQSLVNEQLQMYGVEVYYLPRTYATTNTIIHEVIESEFKNAYPLEAYIDNYEGYTGQGSILSKFGIENRDDLQLIISKERFENYIAPLTEGLPNMELTSRPKEGDLIYFPLGDRLFEIKFVEHEQPFYQLKKTYVYELRCELFRYEDEVIDTGVDTIDDEIAQIGYIQTLNLIGVGSTATAEADWCASGAVNEITISNMGRGYTAQPVVGFSSAPAGGVTATGIASVSYEYPGCKGRSGVIPTILMDLQRQQVSLPQVLFNPSELQMVDLVMHQHQLLLLVILQVLILSGIPHSTHLILPLIHSILHSHVHLNRQLVYRRLVHLVS